MKTKINKLIRIITLAAAATISSCSVAYASNTSQTGVSLRADSSHEACSILAGTAKAVMQGRQQGVPIQGLMQIAIKNDSSITKLMIQEAYELPRYSTKEYQQKAISDFSNQWYLDCYKVAQERNKT